VRTQNQGNQSRQGPPLRGEVGLDQEGLGMHVNVNLRGWGAFKKKDRLESHEIVGPARLVKLIHVLNRKPSAWTFFEILL
jgi:hypothetical protein